MLFNYKKFHRKTENEFIATATSMIACCDKIIAFCLENQVDYLLGGEILLVRLPNSPNEKSFQFRYCPFCGEANRSVEVDGHVKMPTSKKTKK